MYEGKCPTVNPSTSNEILTNNDVRSWTVNCISVNLVALDCDGVYVTGDRHCYVTLCYVTLRSKVRRVDRQLLHGEVA